MRPYLLLPALVLVGCSSSSASTVAAPGPDAAADSPAQDTWSSYAQGFTSTYCVECHNGSDSQGRDYTQYSKVTAEKNTIRCGVAVAQDPSWSCAAFPPPKQFPISDGKTPPNPKPTDAERTRFVGWLSAGAPQ